MIKWLIVYWYPHNNRFYNVEEYATSKSKAIENLLNVEQDAVIINVIEL